MYANVADSSTGTVIAGHRIVGTLARSSLGVAYRAVDQDDTPVILRLFNPPGGRAAVERFEARAKLLSSVSHPATARVTGFGEAPEGLWLATAEVEGVTLRRLIDGEIEPMRAVRLLGEIADGLDAAHAAGLPHGDVRAGNMIVQGRHNERAILVGFPLDAGTADAARDVSQLAAVLRGCLPPEHHPDAAKHTTAGELIESAAQSLLAADAIAPAPPTHLTGTAPRRRRRSVPPLVTAAAALLLVAGAAAAGYAVSDGSEPDPPARPSDVSAGALTVTAPPGWERAASARGLSELKDQVVLRRRSPAGAISAGVAVQSAAALDPSNLAAELAGRAPRPRRVRLGRLTALRYEGPRDDDAAVLYVASTSKGALAVACSGSSVDEACAEAARGLDLRGARPYDPAAGIAWKNSLATDMRRLRARRARGLSALRAAARPRAQAAAAGRIAGTHGSATRSIRGRAAPPQAAGAKRRVLASLRRADRAYRSLARAARAGNEAAYARSLRRVRSADRRLRVTLRSL